MVITEDDGVHNGLIKDILKWNESNWNGMKTNLDEQIEMSRCFQWWCRERDGCEAKVVLHYIHNIS